MYFNIDQKKSNTAILKFLQVDTFRNVMEVYSQKNNLINRFILHTSMLSNLLVPLSMLKKTRRAIGQKSYKK